MLFPLEQTPRASSCEVVRYPPNHELHGIIEEWAEEWTKLRVRAGTRYEPWHKRFGEIQYYKYFQAKDEYFQAVITKFTPPHVLAGQIHHVQGHHAHISFDDTHSRFGTVLHFYKGDLVHIQHPDDKSDAIQDTDDDDYSEFDPERYGETHIYKEVLAGFLGCVRVEYEDFHLRCGEIAFYCDGPGTMHCLRVEFADLHPRHGEIHVMGPRDGSDSPVHILTTFDSSHRRSGEKIHYKYFKNEDKEYVQYRSHTEFDHPNDRVGEVIYYHKEGKKKRTEFHNPHKRSDEIIYHLEQGKNVCVIDSSSPFRRYICEDGTRPGPALCHQLFCERMQDFFDAKEREEMTEQDYVAFKQKIEEEYGRVKEELLEDLLDNRVKGNISDEEYDQCVLYVEKEYYAFQGVATAVLESRENQTSAEGTQPKRRPPYFTSNLQEHLDNLIAARDRGELPEEVYNLAVEEVMKQYKRMIRKYYTPFLDSGIITKEEFDLLMNQDPLETPEYAWDTSDHYVRHHLEETVLTRITVGDEIATQSSHATMVTHTVNTVNTSERRRNERKRAKADEKQRKADKREADKREAEQRKADKREADKREAEKKKQKRIEEQQKKQHKKQQHLAEEQEKAKAERAEPDRLQQEEERKAEAERAERLQQEEERKAEAERADRLQQEEQKAEAERVKAINLTIEQENAAAGIARRRTRQGAGYLPRTTQRPEPRVNLQPPKAEPPVQATPKRKPKASKADKYSEFSQEVYQRGLHKEIYMNPKALFDDKDVSQPVPTQPSRSSRPTRRTLPLWQPTIFLPAARASSSTATSSTATSSTATSSTSPTSPPTAPVSTLPTSPPTAPVSTLPTSPPVSSSSSPPRRRWGGASSSSDPARN